MSAGNVEFVSMVGRWEKGNDEHWFGIIELQERLLRWTPVNLGSYKRSVRKSAGLSHRRSYGIEFGYKTVR